MSRFTDRLYQGLTTLSSVGLSGALIDDKPAETKAARKQRVWSALHDDRNFTINRIGVGAWDVADVMKVLEDQGVL